MTKKIRTYCDACILITASRFEDNFYLDFIDDPNREFASSIFAKLETIPKAVFHKFEEQVGFLETFFDAVLYWPAESEIICILKNALELAKLYGLNAIDSIHCASALHLNCDELFTHEKPTKPMYNIPGLTIKYIEKPPNQHSQ